MADRCGRDSLTKEEDGKKNIEKYCANKSLSMKHDEFQTNYRNQSNSRWIIHLY